MLKLFKILAIVVAALFLLLVLFIATFDANRYKDKIAETVEETTGRKLQINGDLELNLINFPTIKIEDVSLSNANWASTPNMASIKLLELDIAVIPLLSGDIKINKLTLIEPKIALEVNEQNIANWQLITASEVAEKDQINEEARQFAFSLDGIKLENASFSYVNKNNGHNHQLSINQLTINKASEAELAIDINANYQNTPLVLSANTSLLRHWLNDESVSLKLNITANNNAEIHINGGVDSPITAQQLSFDLSADIPDFNSLSAIAGADLPQLDPISLNTSINKTAQDITLDKLQLKLGQSDLSGQVNLALAGEKPELSADLASQLLDIEALLNSLSTNSEDTLVAEADTSTPATETEQTLPFETLSSVNAKLNLSLKQIKLPETVIDDVSVQADLHNNELSLKPLKLAVAQGLLNGELYLDARQKAVNANTTLNVEHIALAQLPGMKHYIANTQTDLTLTAQVSGETVEQLINSAKAQLQLQMGQSEIKAAKGSASPQLATFDNLLLDVAVDQSNKTIVLNQLNLANPVVLAQINDEGIANWQYTASEPTTETPVSETSEDTTPYQLVIKQVDMTQAQLSYHDATNEQAEQVLIESFKLKEQNADTLAINTSVKYKEAAVQLSGTFGQLMGLLNNQDFPLDLTATLNEHNTLSATGQIQSPLTDQSLALKLTASIPELASLSRLANTELPALKPVNLSAQLKRNQNDISVQNLLVTHGSSDLEGAFTVNLSADQPHINAELKSKLLDLTELPKSEQAEDKQAKDKDAKVFPSDPVSVDLLKKLTGNITIQADKIKTDAMEINNTLITAKAADGAITFTPLKADMVGGQLNGYLQLATLEESVAINADINLTHIQLGQIKSLKEQVTQGGATDALIQLKGVGKSIRAIMAKSNGVMTIQTGPAELNIEGGLLTSDLLTGLLPSADGNNNMKLDCAVMNYSIKDGIATADKGIAIVTNKMNIIGSSEINLETEALNINLKPHVREGLGISMAELADLVSIGGTLANPSMGADMMSTLTTGLEVQTAIATGGLSILAKGLFDKITADANPCATALGTESLPKQETNTNNPAPIK